LAARKAISRKSANKENNEQVRSTQLEATMLTWNEVKSKL
jgi:hypothetical protein